MMTNDNEQNQSSLTPNPYGSAMLSYPKKFHSAVQGYVKTSTAGASFVNAPFERVVDIWFLSVCLGARAGKRKKLTNNESQLFMNGVVLSSDDYRIDFIELLALGHEDFDPKDLGKTSQPVTIANEYANEGMPIVLDMLENGQQEALFNLAASIRDVEELD